MKSTPVNGSSSFTSSHLGQMEKCKRCSSEHQDRFNGEIALHFPGVTGLNKPIVWVFPKLLVCLSCGFTEFTVPETELRVLADGISVNDAMVSPRAA
jgi:hypothetical protein